MKMPNALALTAAAFLSASLVSQPAAFAEDGDAVAGEKTFKKCSACHSIGPDAKHKVGPILTGVVGRAAASAEGYTKYGDSIIAAGEAGLVWTEEEIFTYLADPKAFLRMKLDDKSAKSRMAFKLKKEDDRRNVIAYLKTFSESQ